MQASEGTGSCNRLPEEFPQDELQVSFLAICDIFDDPMERTNAKGFMAGDRKVMLFSIHHGRKPLVTPGLVIDRIPIPVKKTGKFVTIDISGQFHTAINSSFTR